MDLSTDDQRALALAPHVVVVRSSATGAEWCNPATGTTCRLEGSGEYVVLRRVHDRFTPVVAGTILPEDADTALRHPDDVRARRAAALAIVAVDGGVVR